MFGIIGVEFVQLVEDGVVTNPAFSVVISYQVKFNRDVDLVSPIGKERATFSCVCKHFRHGCLILGAHATNAVLCFNKAPAAKNDSKDEDFFDHVVFINKEFCKYTFKSGFCNQSRPTNTYN